MRIAVASGKGGTGKTTLATSMAVTLAQDHAVWLVDCDVEAPNAHLFLNPTFNQKSDAVIRIPKIDTQICTSCGICVQVCQFHALAKIDKTIMVFPQLCHGCGSCTINCPQKAITEIPNPIGTLESGTAMAGVQFSRGTLTISEPMPTPVIRQLKQSIKPDRQTIVIFDAPPGASCSVVETLRGVDFALLVAEPSPFGIHDLNQILGIVNEMKIPVGVVINRVGMAGSQLEDFLKARKIPVLLRIPFSKKLARAIASGALLIDAMPEYNHQIRAMVEEIFASGTKKREKRNVS